MSFKASGCPRSTASQEPNLDKSALSDEDLKVLLRSAGSDQLRRIMGVGHASLMQMGEPTHPIRSKQLHQSGTLSPKRQTLKALSPKP